MPPTPGQTVGTAIGDSTASAVTEVAAETTGTASGSSSAVGDSTQYSVRVFNRKRTYKQLPVRNKQSSRRSK